MGLLKTNMHQLSAVHPLLVIRKESVEQMVNDYIRDLHSGMLKEIETAIEKKKRCLNQTIINVTIMISKLSRLMDEYEASIRNRSRVDCLQICKDFDEELKSPVYNVRSFLDLKFIPQRNKPFEDFGFIKSASCLPSDIRMKLASQSDLNSKEKVTFNVSVGKDIDFKKIDPQIGSFIEFSVVRENGESVQTDLQHFNSVKKSMFDRNGTCELSFTPEFAGNFIAIVTLYGVNVSGSPLHVIIGSSQSVQNTSETVNLDSGNNKVREGCMEFNTDLWKNIEHKTKRICKKKFSATLLHREKSQDILDMQCPTGVTSLTHHDTIVVTDISKNLVHLLTSDFRYKRSVGSRGVHVGSFDIPFSVVSLESVGCFAVKDNVKIQLFTPEGYLCMCIGRNKVFSHHGLASSGNYLYSIKSDPVFPLLTVFDIRNPKSEISFPYRSFVGCKEFTCSYMTIADSRLYVGDTKSSVIYKSELHGLHLDTLGYHSIDNTRTILASPTGLCAFNNNLFVADSCPRHCISVFSTKSGTYRGEVEADFCFSHPSGIHVTKDGHLLVLEQKVSQLSMYQLNSRNEI
ncbi:Uncharacterised protein g3305 [Pycnogonum litorale]